MNRAYLEAVRERDRVERELVTRRVRREASHEEQVMCEHSVSRYVRVLARSSLRCLLWPTFLHARDACCFDDACMFEL